MLRSVALAASAALTITVFMPAAEKLLPYGGGSAMAAQKSGGGGGGGGGGGNGKGGGGGGGKKGLGDGAAAAKACPEGQTYQCRPSPTKGVPDICGCRKVK